MEYNGNIEELTKVIKCKMIEKDVKQKGWSQSTVSNILNNRTPNPSLELLLNICNAMDCKLIIDIE